MIITWENLLEIEDYINHLEETIGLKPETVIDIARAIANKKSEIKKKRNEQDTHNRIISKRPKKRVFKCVGNNKEMGRGSKAHNN